MYNMVHGTNPLAGDLMKMLWLEPKDVGRFRDCYLQRDSTGQLEVHVFTRNGGGNREAHEEVTERLRAHPGYLRDFDDEYDCTYASYVFTVPNMISLTAEFMARTYPDEVLLKSFRERSDEFLRKLSASPDDPQVKRVNAAMRPLFDKLTSAMKVDEDKS